jgi:hypothetical protein
MERFKKIKNDLMEPNLVFLWTPKRFSKFLLAADRQAAGALAVGDL